MKIIYLHQYFNTPEMSGGTRSYEMARRWVAAGHEVHVITASIDAGSGRSWSTTDVGGATIHWRAIPYDNSMGFRERVTAFFAFALAAAPLARSLRGDVVFATSTPLTIIFPAWYATILRRTPIVFEVRDLWPEMPIAAGYIRNPLLKWLVSGIERLAYKSSRRVVALSDGMADGVCAAGTPASKVVVAPNSCDVELFDIPEAFGSRYREQQDWLGSRPFVAYCGAIGELNDVSYLVRLAACMRVRDPDVVFGIYGTGKEEPKVRDLASTLGVLGVNLFMMGAIPKNQIPSVLSAASIVASIFCPIPQMRVNSANKFFDGLAAARPIVINYEGWQASLLRATGAGIVLDAYNVDRSAEELAAYLADPERLAIASVASRRLGNERFSRDRIARIVLDTIEAAVRPSDGRGF